MTAILFPLDPDTVAQLEILKNLPQFRLQVLGELRADAYRKVYTYAEVLPGPQLGQEPTPQEIPDFRGHGPGQPERSFLIYRIRRGFGFRCGLLRGFRIRA